MNMTEDQNSPGETGINDRQARIQRPVIELVSANVPPELRPLIPFAEKWGIRDQALQRKLLHEAPLAEIEELCVILYPLWHSINRFSMSYLSPDEPGDYEVRVFNAFSAVFEEAFSILKQKKPARVLEIIGWPEAFPGPKLDPAKLPPELHPLILFAEKWVIYDDGVRDNVLRVATNEELEELLLAVNQIGGEVVRDLAFKMIDDETRKEEGYIFALLMDLVDNLSSR
jgi:hypothetical protein